MPNDEPSLKLKTARTLKWNTLDRVASQVIFAVVGVVLANLLSKKDFGLVGALLIFQAFATLLTDGGFGMALLQKKNPSQTDYSSVFWFNLIVSIAIYGILWLGAPLIADMFEGDLRLIPLARWMFLSFVLNGLSLVQTTRLMKEMNVKMVAVSNLSSLVAGGVVGIVLACNGFGAWAIVWQNITNAAAKSVILWLTSRWSPSAVISLASLRSIVPVGSSVLSTQILNTACLYACNFVIGIYYGLKSLGVYTQADKWSKMGSATLTQILSSTFIPLLARCGDDILTRRRYVKRINRFTAMILMPVMLGLILVGTPLFHTLFGTKWDDAIVIFQILCFRGIFVVLITLYYNYCVSVGRAKTLYIIEMLKDVTLFAAIFLTIWSGSMQIIVWGQLAASLLTYAVVLVISAKAIEYPVGEMLTDLVPFTVIALAACVAAGAVGALISTAWLKLTLELATGLIVYAAIIKIARVPEFNEMTGYLFGRFRRQS